MWYTYSGNDVYMHSIITLIFIGHLVASVDNDIVSTMILFIPQKICFGDTHACAHTYIQDLMCTCILAGYHSPIFTASGHQLVVARLL